MWWTDSDLTKAETREVQFSLTDSAVVPVWLRPAAEVDRAGDLDIVTFARERLGFVAEESQLSFLKSRAKRGIVNCSRQWGKSTLAAIKAVYRAWTVPGCLVLVAGPTERQSGEMLAKIGTLVRQNTDWRLRGDGFNDLSLLFPNGSRIVGLPGKEANIRGFSAVSMLIIDEAARVPDVLYKALRPMLAVGSGDLWVLSTPMGKRGFFYEEFEFGGDRWERIRVTVAECGARISAEFLEDELASMGPAWVRQEFFCEFIDTGGEMFDRQLVEDAVTEDIEPFQFS